MREHIFIYISKQEVVSKTHAEFPLFMQETTKLLMTCIILVSTTLHFRFQLAYRTLIARENFKSFGILRLTDFLHAAVPVSYNNEVLS